MISNCPELHRLVLETWTRGEAELCKQDQPAFHFSAVNYGDCWLFIYLLPQILINVAGCTESKICFVLRAIAASCGGSLH